MKYLYRELFLYCKWDAVQDIFRGRILFVTARCVACKIMIAPVNRLNQNDVSMLVIDESWIAWALMS